MQPPINAATAATALATSAWAVIAFSLAARAESKKTCRTSEFSVFALAGAFVVVAACVVMSARITFPAAVASIAIIAAAPADARTGYIFDAVMLPAAGLAVVASIADGSLDAAVPGALLTVGLFGGLWLASRGRWLGLGDVKALYVVGVAFGPSDALLIVALASIGGTIVAFARRLLQRGRAVAFAPYLAAGATATLLWGQFITHRLLGLPD